MKSRRTGRAGICTPSNKPGGSAIAPGLVLTHDDEFDAPVATALAFRRIGLVGAPGPRRSHAPGCGTPESPKISSPG
ncbi:hypothetical protein [Nocardia gipuzkoensis]|uniref:hypothetical protein n=1 Tax=Nocardia gipuzkoensis TaxID=2749991 RepID=UPI003EE3F795